MIRLCPLDEELQEQVIPETGARAGGSGSAANALVAKKEVLGWGPQNLHQAGQGEVSGVDMCNNESQDCVRKGGR